MLRKLIVAAVLALAPVSAAEAVGVALQGCTCSGTPPLCDDYLSANTVQPYPGNTVNAGTNLAITLTIIPDAAGTVNVSSAVWDVAGANQAFTRVNTGWNPGVQNGEIWALVNPTPGTNKTITITLGSSAPVFVSACVWTGVSQAGGAASFPHPVHGTTTTSISVPGTNGGVMIAVASGGGFLTPTGTTIYADSVNGAVLNAYSNYDAAAAYGSSANIGSSGGVNIAANLIQPADCGLQTVSSGNPKIYACIDTLATAIVVTDMTGWPGSGTVETIAGGGGGALGSISNNAAGGGGGGYSKSTSVSLSGTVGIHVGAAGVGATAIPAVAATNGEDSWVCNATTNCASLSGTAVQVGSQHGSGGAGNTVAPVAGAGGAASSGVGMTKQNGGAGGPPNNGSFQITGGGGAGGPGGDGGTGGAVDPGSSAGGSGGGGNGGGGNGATTVANAGSAGGTAFDTTAGGTGGSAGPPPTSGGNGSHGSGGGGGGGDQSAMFTVGAAGNGGNGVDWSSTFGSGGGGGASGGGNGDPGFSGGNGGLYGAGGGSAGFSFSTVTGGNGAQGIVVLSFATSTGVTCKHNLSMLGAGC